MQTLTTHNWTIRILDSASDSLQEEVTVTDAPKRLCTIILNDGSVESVMRLDADHAIAEHVIIYIATGNSTPQITLKSEHAAVDTKARLIIHGVALDTARVNIVGNIDILTGAKQTDGELRHEGILLSERAQISALPGFEIHSNDVKAAHSSAVYYIRPDQLFYLQTRGLSPEVSRQMIVEGFLLDALKDLDDADITQSVEAAILETIRARLTSV